MNQQPDKLFRDKLEGFQKNPPASVWDRISAAQHKKKSKGVWLRVAASLLLLAGISYVFWPKKPTPGTTLSKVTVISPDTIRDTLKSLKPSGIADPSVQPVKEDQRDHLAHEASKPAKRRSKQTPDNVIQPVEEYKTNDMATVNEALQPLPASTVIDALATEKEYVAVAEKKSITLNYSSDEVSAYLNKNEVAEATSDENKPSTLKKLLKKANDLKTNQDPVGELRHKKNEILALNFRSDKQRGQNK